MPWLDFAVQKNKIVQTLRVLVLVFALEVLGQPERPVAGQAEVLVEKQQV